MNYTQNSQHQSGPRSKLEMVFVGAFLIAWMTVFGLVLGQALLYYLHQAIITLRGHH